MAGVDPVSWSGCRTGRVASASTRVRASSTGPGSTPSPSTNPTGNPSGLTETLYVELRQGKETLDPSDWFVMNPVVGQSDQIRTSE